MLGTQKYEDYFQSGVVGLIKAVKYFSEEYDNTFSTYAVPTILGEIRRRHQNFAMSELKVPRSIKNIRQRIIAMRGKGKTDVEICEEIGFTEEELKKVEADFPTVVSLQENYFFKGDKL